MKAIYLIISLILTVFILILAFGNVKAECSNVHFLFYPIRLNSTIIVLSIAAIGILTGAFYQAFLSRTLKSVDEEEEDKEDKKGKEK